MAQLRACPACGNMIARGVRSCPSCGKRFTSPLTWMLALGCILPFAFMAVCAYVGVSGFDDGSIPRAEPTPRPAPALEMIDMNASMRHDYVTITGSVTNSGDAPAQYVRINFDWHDSDGNVIDSHWAYVVDSQPLEPGESRKFETTNKYDSRMKTYTYLLEY